MFSQVDLAVWKLNEADQSTLVIRLQIPALYAFLPLLGAPIRILLDQVEHLDDDQRPILAYNLELAAYETCTNIIEHAYGETDGVIELFFALDQAQTLFTIGFRDHGRYFDFQAGAVHLPQAEQTRGYGLYLMQELVDEVQHWSNGDGNHWRLIKRLAP